MLQNSFLSPHATRHVEGSPSAVHVHGSLHALSRGPPKTGVKDSTLSPCKWETFGAFKCRVMTLGGSSQGLLLFSAQSGPTNRCEPNQEPQHGDCDSSTETETFRLLNIFTYPYKEGLLLPFLEGLIIKGEAKCGNSAGL